MSRPLQILFSFTLAVTMLLTFSSEVQSRGRPFDELSAEHGTIRSDIANLQAAVEVLGSLVPPCGASTAG